MVKRIKRWVKPLEDLQGKKFGSLTGIKLVGRVDKRILWVWQCVCGKRITRPSSSIKSIAKHDDNPNSPSCGCMRSKPEVHGLSKHPLMSVYTNMKARCNNPKDAQYKTYGAKGVTVCKEWRTVSKFLEWALPKWEKGLVLDKDILSDKLNIFPHIYSPDTCQFITRKENNEYSNGRRSFGANKNIKISFFIIKLLKCGYINLANARANVKPS